MPTRPASGRFLRAARVCRARTWAETLEPRTLLSAAADITGLTALRADPAFAGVDGSGVGVAVIDTGAFAAHPDLRDNFVAYRNDLIGNVTLAQGEGFGLPLWHRIEQITLTSPS